MAESDRVWYLRREGEKKSAGPFSTEQLLARWQKGELDRSSAAWQEGMLDWRPLLDLEPFASANRVSLDVPGVIRFYCECHNEIVMAERFAGRVAKCGVCGREVTVPDPYATHDEAEQKRARARRRPRWLIAVGAVACLGVLAMAAVWYFAIRPKDAGVADQPAAQVAQPAEETPPSEQAGGQKAKTSLTGSTTAESEPSVDEKQATDAGSTLAATADTAQKDKPAGPDSLIPSTDVGKSTGSPPKQKAASQEPTPTTTKAPARDNERTVQYLAREFVAAFRTQNSTSLERLSELLAENCTVVTATGEMIKGKKAVLQTYTETIEKNRARYRILQVRFPVDASHVTSDSALLSGRLVYEGRLKSRTGSTMQEFRQTINFTKQEDVWRIIQIHMTKAPPKSGGAG